MIKSSTIPQCEPRRIPERVFKSLDQVNKILLVYSDRISIITKVSNFDYWSFVWLSKYCGKDGNYLNYGYVIDEYNEWKVRQ